VSVKNVFLLLSCKSVFLSLFLSFLLVSRIIGNYVRQSKLDVSVWISVGESPYQPLVLGPHFEVAGLGSIWLQLILKAGGNAIKAQDF
jgi:hypothetical protein